MRIHFSLHAIRRMSSRGISAWDVRNAIETGEIIEEYPDDTPYPSALLLATIDDSPLHVVVAMDRTEDRTIVVSLYRPDPLKWEPGFRKRRVM
ncbi:MAG: DUF4258 domain-containing protein [Acidobacteria bacterium]|nr:DUF4258 domain-containing protein [Acidobacteriota bacterium]